MNLKQKIDHWLTIRRADALLKKRRISRGDPVELYKEARRRENWKAAIFAFVFVAAMVAMKLFDNGA